MEGLNQYGLLSERKYRCMFLVGSIREKKSSYEANKRGGGGLRLFVLRCYQDANVPRPTSHASHVHNYDLATQ
jgi:hypothetical protein